MARKKTDPDFIGTIMKKEEDALNIKREHLIKVYEALSDLRNAADALRDAASAFVESGSGTRAELTKNLDMEKWESTIAFPVAKRAKHASTDAESLDSSSTFTQEDTAGQNEENDSSTTEEKLVYPYTTL
ncbi:hypothetical protein B9G54_04505 [Alloscardovia macacae]|uniref:Uncharacterized protein n=1 Tax=Alloscardovia macacae TaxID=1160091 RepID=A0A1Y2SXF5_9BIFI|nr:hypothetical protein [Alloscardovia macacae]OTA26456.1 hypothetical protein B9G54_04505 [Alloscardovia macacae]OTA29864.1 hypothetical protein B9T39_01940 [Alloscardovia macacae]